MTDNDLIHLLVYVLIVNYYIKSLHSEREREKDIETL